MRENLQTSHTSDNSESLCSLSVSSQEQRENSRVLYQQNFGETNSGSSYQTLRSTHYASNSSQGSSSSSITTAMKRANLRSRSGSKSLSIRSKDLATSSNLRNSDPIRFGRNNSAQQNLDIYIANSRREVASSSFLKRRSVNDEASRAR